MPDALHFTGDPEADALIARDPLALLIGFALDQQVSVPTAFSGPLKLQRRLGRLDAAEIAAMDPSRLEAAQGLVPDQRTLGDVDSFEALETYQAEKRAYKASLRSG